MNKNKKYAISWAILLLAYFGIAAWNFWMHQLLAGIIILLGGWALGVSNVFTHAALYGLDLVLEDALEILRSDRKQMEDLRKKRTEVWNIDAHGTNQLKCQDCGGTQFTRAAGRYICACCGSVLEEEHEGDSV